LKGAVAGAAGLVAKTEPGNAQQRPDDHDHDHDHPSVPSDPALRTKALESLLVQKGLVDPAALDLVVEAFQTRIGPQNGARVVAKAWVDTNFKTRLLADAPRAIGELGYTIGDAENLIVVENGPRCTTLWFVPSARVIRGHCLVFAGMVQVGCISFTRGNRSARHSPRLWSHATG
jgi:Nitrile hydratase, alpha chain